MFRRNGNMNKIIKLIAIFLALTMLSLPVLGEMKGGNGNSMNAGRNDSNRNNQGMMDSSNNDNGSMHEKASEMFDNGSRMRDNEGVKGMGFMHRGDNSYGSYVTFTVDNSTGNVLNFGIAGIAVFDSIKQHGTLPIFLPYQNFDPIVRLIEEAADDPDVLAIKQTLYRVSGNSPVVRALAKAAMNGKQVTVIVELKARFDEEHNIQWARQLEEAGAHVIYGMAGLKIHAKALLIVRREEGIIKRYVHTQKNQHKSA